MKTFKLKALFCGITFIAMTGTVAAQKTLQWDMPNEYPASSIQGEGDRFFAEKIKEYSDGEIEIINHFGGALGLRSKDQLDAVTDGVVEIANTFIPPLAGIDPIFTLSSLPFLVSTPEEAKTLYEIAKPFYETTFEEDHNQKFLYASPWPASGLWGTDAYKNMDDIKRLKLRTFDVHGSHVFREADSSPIQLSWADIVPQLSTGGINAVLTSLESGLSASFNDYTKYFTEIAYDTTIAVITLNLDTWNDLNDSQQEAVLKAAADAEDFVWQNIYKAIERNHKAAEERGVTVITEIDPGFREKLVELSQPVIDAWVEEMGPDGAKIIEAYYEQVGK